MDIVVITAVVASLFFAIGLAEPLAAKIRLPFSVVLAAYGVLIGLGSVFFLQTRFTDALNPVATSILALPIRSNVFLYVFLPTLLFQVTLEVNLRRMLDDWVPILVLAVVAVLVATLSVGYALWWASALPLVACLLVGSIVSTTDPSAVVGIFRSIAAPRRLSRIIEGESLLNDAAAIALFGLFMGFVMLGVPDPTIGGAAAQFPRLILGGVLVGWVMAGITVRIMAALARYELAQISISVALPYLAYVVAEQGAGASGVVATVAAGLALNFQGPGRLSPRSWSFLREVWDVLAHWAGALIFILVALLIPRLLSDTRIADLGLVAVVIGAAIAARAAILFGLLPVLSAMGLSPRVERPYRVAILWGGLRGAVTLALALAVTESTRVPEDVQRVVGILATGFTLFTLIVQGTTLRWVIGLLRLDRLSAIDAALANQVVAVSLQNVREEVASITEQYKLTQSTVRSEAKRFAERLDTAVETAETGAAIGDRDRITLSLIALAGAERDMILARLRERTISARLADRSLTDADRLIEAARSGGRTGYRGAASVSLRGGLLFRMAIFGHNRLGLNRPLARLTADRFEVLLSQRLILNDLMAYIDRRIRRIHGRRVAQLLHELLDRRADLLDQALEGLRLQFPGYSENLERRFIRRTALRLEEREYDMMRDDGLIGDELHLTLMRDLDDRRNGVEKRPSLDIALRKDDLIRQFPLFADLDDAALRRLNRALVTRYVASGTRLVRADVPARNVYFIVSGAVELETATHTYRLGRGEMFGQLSILLKKSRRVQATTISFSTLLLLDEARFLALLARSSALREAVLESGRTRGLDIEDVVRAV